MGILITGGWDGRPRGKTGIKIGEF